MHGRAELVFSPRGLARLGQRAPLRVLFPDPPAGEPPVAALVTTSGGLTSGDRLELAVTVEDGARALVVASAAEKLYRSTGADTLVEVDLAAGVGSWLEFLPQETILFDGSRLRRRTRIAAAAGAQVLAGEMLVFGRTARGERLTRGLVRDAWEIVRDGRLVWADALHLDGDLARPLSAAAGFAGAVACATVVLLADDPNGHRDRVRQVLAGTGGRAGATVVNGVLVVRWLDSDARRLRASFAAVWTELRRAAAGLPAAMPRLWEI